MHLNKHVVDLSPYFSIRRIDSHELISNLLMERFSCQSFFFWIRNLKSEIIMIIVVICNISSSNFSIFLDISENIAHIFEVKLVMSFFWDLYFLLIFFRFSYFFGNLLIYWRNQFGVISWGDIIKDFGCSVHSISHLSCRQIIYFFRRQ